MKSGTCRFFNDKLHIDSNDAKQQMKQKKQVEIIRKMILMSKFNNFETFTVRKYKFIGINVCYFLLTFDCSKKWVSYLQATKKKSKKKNHNQPD